MKPFPLVTLCLSTLLFTACSWQIQPPATETPAASFGEAWETVTCSTFGIADELAAQADCGYVTVQENRATNSERTIRLAVVRVRSTAETPGSPVFKGTGGPGGAGFGRATPNFAQSNANILEDRDYIFFSQRGTEYAEPYLVCDAYDSVPFDAAINGWTTEEIATNKRESLQSCVDDFAATGVDFAAYNSDENAADINDIRQALGYEKIIYLGESYGTMLGQFLMRNHPEILEAVILDGIAPVSALHWSDVTSMPAAFERVFDVCAQDEACHAAYPFPESALADAFAALNANPQTIELNLGGQTASLAVDGTMMMNAMFLQLYIAGGYAEVPAIAYQLQANHLVSLYSILPLYLSSGGSARLMHFAVACSDDPVNSLDEVNVDGAAEMYVALAYDDAQNYAMACPLLALTQLPATSDEAVTSDLPVLLLNGGLDPATQAEPARALQATLPNSQYVLFPDGSHIQHNSPCGQAILDAFMSDPFAPVDESCIPQDYNFALPQRVSVTSADGKATLTMALPIASPAGPGAWVTPYGAINLQIYPAGTPTEEAITAYYKTLPVPVELVFTETEDVAGYPTTQMSADSLFQGNRIGVDTYAFTSDQATYLITFITQTTAFIDSFRQNDLAGLLETVEVIE